MNSLNIDCSILGKSYICLSLYSSSDGCNCDFCSCCAITIIYHNQHTMPYHTTPCHTIPYHTITISYHTILYHTIILPMPIESCVFHCSWSRTQGHQRWQRWWLWRNGGGSQWPRAMSPGDITQWKMTSYLLVNWHNYGNISILKS